MNHTNYVNVVSTLYPQLKNLRTCMTRKYNESIAEKHMTSFTYLSTKKSQQIPGTPGREVMRPQQSFGSFLSVKNISQN